MLQSKTFNKCGKATAKSVASPQRGAFHRRYVYMLRYMLLLFIGLPSTAHATSWGPCLVSVERLPEASEIRTRDSECFSNHCSIGFEIDKKAGDFTLSGVFLSRHVDPVFEIPLETNKETSFVTTYVTADPKFFDEIFVVSIYSGPPSCEVTSMLELSHNKERNGLDATVVAPIR